jgi:plasmid stabilization system protein ParE
VGRSEGENHDAAVGPSISIQPEAEAEIQEAYRWYEDRAEGLGQEFLEAVHNCLANISRHPLAYAAVRGVVRRAVLHRFPYGIFYALENDVIAVLACFHSSRDPREWQRRIKRKDS